MKQRNTTYPPEKSNRTSKPIKIPQKKSCNPDLIYSPSDENSYILNVVRAFFEKEYYNENPEQGNQGNEELPIGKECKDLTANEEMMFPLEIYGGSPNAEY